LAALAFASALGVDCDPDDVTKCVANLSQGAPAPFAGQLLTPALAIALAQKTDACVEKAVADIAREKSLGLAALELAHAEAVADQQAYEAKTALLMKHLAEVDDVALTREPWFVAAVSIASTVAVVSLSLWGLGQLR
jgi:hypothetical protein